MATNGAQVDPQFAGELDTFHGLSMATDGTWIAPKDDYSGEYERFTLLDIDVRGNLLKVGVETTQVEIDMKITHQ